MISSGVVHEVPVDLKKALTSDPQALTAWEDLTPLARNEWICWIESSKKQKLEAAGSSGAVQALRMENDAPVVGPDTPTANSKMVKLDVADRELGSTNCRVARQTPGSSRQLVFRVVVHTEVFPP
jgi:hypothetical protein